MSEKCGEARKYTVIFDGECPLCRKSVDALRARDLGGHLAFVPGQDPEIEETYPGISLDEVAAKLHLVGPDGRIWQGAGAVEELARILPGFRWLRVLFALPFARGVAGVIYGWIATHRYKINCRSHCPR